MNFKFFCIITFCFFQLINSAQSVSAKILDASTKHPIPFATIKTGINSGVISNEEGNFTIHITPEIDNLLIISCLGYQSKTLTLLDIKSTNFVIELNEHVNQLAEVFISNKKLNVDTLIAHVKRNYNNNYSIKLKKYNVFYRATNYTDFKRLHFEIDKASEIKKNQIQLANKELNNLSNTVMTSKSVYFTDFKGSLYIENKDSCKLFIEKATKVIDRKKDFSLDDVQQRAQNIVLKYLDTTKTYKVKSGLFKVQDSLSISNNFNEHKKSEVNVIDLKNNSLRILKRTLIYDDSFLSNLLNSKLYEYQIETANFENDELTYIVSYKPRKGKAKYTGKFYISESNYAITKLDYVYFEDRHGKKLNLKLLLGVKFIETEKKGTIIFTKTYQNIYQPKYLVHQSRNYFYVNRDLTLIENSKDKNKISSTFKIEGNSTFKQELLFTSDSNLEIIEYKNLKQPKTTAYKMLNKYEKSIWENDETLEPLEEMKRFGKN